MIFVKNYLGRAVVDRQPIVFSLLGHCETLPFLLTSALQPGPRASRRFTGAASNSQIFIAGG